jgi:hypothetical protein
MGERLPRVALWSLVVLVLVGTLASVPGAFATSTPTYTLLGYVQQPGGSSAPPAPTGVQVDLISAATHAVYSTKTLAGTAGGFNFTSTGDAPALEPGWWGTWVPPQAHVTVGGSSIPDVILPENQSPTYQYENVSDLTTTNYQVTVTGVQALPYQSTIWGNVTYNGRGAAGAAVQLLDPAYNGFVISNNTTVVQNTNTTVVGEFSISVPYGTWVLQTTIPGSPAYVNYTQVTVNSPTSTVNPVLGAASSYLTWGYVNQAAHPGTHVPTGGNVTLFDPTTGDIYSAATPSGGFYSIGSYPAGFSGSGSNTFDVVLSNIGYQTAWYPLTVSGSSHGGPNPHNVVVPAISTPAVYKTTLDFGKGFGKVHVYTNATLANDSTFPDLANASVGQLWAQLALDWQQNTTFNMANYPTLMAWVQSAGPYFPAGQAMLTVNGTGYGQPTNFTVANTTTCASFCGLGSNASLSLHYVQDYNATAKIAPSARSYTLAFNFRHPTHAEVMNYTVNLPAGYVLSAGQAAPAQTTLVAAGVGGTYTSFTLVSKPSASASGTASLTIVKTGNLTARVNATVANFTFSDKNVLNDSEGNYTVIVGVGENVTFSGANSTFPSSTNGTNYNWTFGDGGTSSVSSPTTNHTFTAAGAYKGKLVVTSSGGQSNSTTFTVYASADQPTAHIAVNSTVVAGPSGVNYTIVNWSTTLHWNATTSTAPLTDAPVPGVVSVAAYNLTSFHSYWLANYSASAGANPLGNDTYTFLGAGHFLTQGYGALSTVKFYGWQYNLTLVLWDAAGHEAFAHLVVLVKDTEKPVPVATLLNSAGKSIGSTGIVEGANHTAYVQLSATNSTAPHNGSLAWFNWSIGNANTTANRTIDIAAPSLGTIPANRGIWLAPQSKAYTVNLTETDRAGNTAWTVVSLTVAINTSTRPVLSVGNLTAPGSMTDQGSYTVWVNVTNTIGKNSTADGVSVLFYLLSPSGSGTPIAIGGSPNSVVWYGYTNGTVNSTVAGTGTINIRYNQTFRAEVQFHPARDGNFGLWANATAANEFVGDYVSGGNQAHVPITLNKNPIINDEIYGGVAAAIIVLIAVLFLLRRQGYLGGTRPTPKAASGKSGLERGGSKKSSDTKADDEDDEP